MLSPAGVSPGGRFTPQVRAAAGAAVSYLVLALLVLAPSVTSLHALASGDLTDLLYPFFNFTQDVFSKEGRLPFWNHHIFSGQPHLVSMNVLAWYPTEIAALATGMSAHAFYALDAVLHLTMAGTGMYLLMRASGCSQSGSFTSGLCYAFGAHVFTLVGAGHPHWVRCMAWLPLMFLCLERGVNVDRGGWFAAAGSCLGMCVLTSQMQFVACATAVGVVWIGAAALSGRSMRTGEAFPVVATRIALFGAAAAGLGAVVWVPGLEYFMESVRADPSSGFSARGALAAADLAAVVLPELWGMPGGYFGPHLFRPTSDHPGLIALGLACAGTIAAWRNRGPGKTGGMRWLLLGAGGLVLAFGPAGFAGRLLADLPVFSGFRTPARWLSFAHFAGCALVAFGWDAVNRGRRGPSMAAIAVLVAVSAGSVILSAFSGILADLTVRDLLFSRAAPGNGVGVGTVEETMRFALHKGAAVAAVAAAAVAILYRRLAGEAVRYGVAWILIVAELLVVSFSFFSFAPAFGWVDSDAVGGFLKGRRSAAFRAATDEYVGLQNRRMHLGLEWIGGYHGLPLRRYQGLLENLDAVSPAHGFSLLNVHYHVSKDGSPNGWPTVMEAGGYRVLGNPNPPAGAFTARDVVICNGVDDVHRVLTTPGWDPGTVPVETGDARGAVPAGPVDASARVVAVMRGQDEVRIEVESGGSALVVLSDAWYPAWRAFLGGRRVRVLRAYGALRAIAVPRGRHVIWMVYESIWFKVGLLATSVALVVLVTLAFRRPVAGGGRA